MGPKDHKYHALAAGQEGTQDSTTLSKKLPPCLLNFQGVEKKTSPQRPEVGVGYVAPICLI